MDQKDKMTSHRCAIAGGALGECEDKGAAMEEKLFCSRFLCNWSKTNDEGMDGRMK